MTLSLIRGGGDGISNLRSTIALLTDKVYFRYLGGDIYEIAVITNDPRYKNISLDNQQLQGIDEDLLMSLHIYGNVIFTDNESEYKNWSSENIILLFIVDPLRFNGYDNFASSMRLRNFSLR